MDVKQVANERLSWLKWKNIAPLREKLDALDEIDSIHDIGDVIKISGAILDSEKKHINSLLYDLKPWRKGPFEIFDTFIDTEWDSSIKYNLLEKYFDLSNKCVADVGCNNGYYMFRMLQQNPKHIVGFDPSPHYKTQFDFLNHFIKSDIIYELLGIEHIEFYHRKFDVIFCLGVLYHRSDPIKSLKSLKKSLNKNGVLFLDSFIIDGDDHVALTPKETYSKIPNIYFVPTVVTLTNWCKRAGFKNVEVLSIKKTSLNEQRHTKWLKGDSLENFLDPNNPNLTIEGYPAPKRAYIKALV